MIRHLVLAAVLTLSFPAFSISNSAVERARQIDRPVPAVPKLAPPLMDTPTSAEAPDSSHTTFRNRYREEGLTMNVDVSLAFNPVSSLITDDGGSGSRITLTPAVLFSTELRPGFEFFFGAQYGSHGVPVTLNGKEALASNSALEFPVGVGFPMRNTFLGEGVVGIFRTGLALSLPVSSLGVQNTVIAKTKFSYATYLETGALFPVNDRFSLGATMKLSIGLSNAYEKNIANVERTFVYGFAATSRFIL